MTAINTSDFDFDVIIIGAGASGLYCAFHAAQKGRRVVVLDHANKAGKKILMSGGGRCNFTNYFVEPEHFIGANPHFCKSALGRYPSWEFIARVDAHGIPYHEREHGQLFCDDSAKDIVTMLLNECQNAGATVQLNTQITQISALNSSQKSETYCQFKLTTQKVNKKNHDQTIAQTYRCKSLVIATGGLSIPTMGATGFGFEAAAQFGHTILPTSAGLVPFTFTDKTGELISSLSGISLPVIASNSKIFFKLPLLFTHRGLSGPAMLQLSNYWHIGETITINLAPEVDVTPRLLAKKAANPKLRLRTVLFEDLGDTKLPKKLILAFQEQFWQDIKDTEIANIKDDRLIQIGALFNAWQLKPSGTEGYRTAEVTRGGVNTDEVSSKTMESRLQPNLYFIGEVLDVTGHLGGYNFQWAWASGFACAQAL